MATGQDVAAAVGWWTAVATACLATVSLAMAVTTVPRSGPYCRSGCVSYPYIDVAAYVPRDYLWLYPASGLTLLVVLLAATLQSIIPAGRRVLGRAGGSFAVIGAAVLLVDYGVQLTMVQPALLRQETEGLGLWTQYNPYGVFIALENVGYTVWSLAFVLLGAGLLRHGDAVGRAAGWLLLVAGTLTLVLLLGTVLWYRSRLDYRYEVYAILINWSALIVAPILLAITIRRLRRGQQRPSS